MRKAENLRNRWATSSALLAGLLAVKAGAQVETGQGWTRGRELSWKPTAQVSATIPRYHAIVIGINAYQQPPPVGWETLTTARQDAEAIADVLEKNYGFDVVRIFDRDATRERILQALDRLASYTLDDAVVIYYAGHGMFDEKLGEGFWIPCDAKKRVGQRLAKEDWIWNSTLTKIIGACEARHVLVIADSCYGGSLFRGEQASPSQEDLTWYRRALGKPSRFLISSGDIEPVLDSGGKHSVFAQTLLNLLEFPEKPVFSASDVGLALREKVGLLTGQMVRMGPLAVASHAGGEFVFLTKQADVAELTLASAAAPTGPKRGDEEEARPVEVAAPDLQQAVKDAALMHSQGFTNAAQTLLSAVLDAQPDHPLARALAAYFERRRAQDSRSELRSLIDRLEKRKAEAAARRGAAELYARPRILACIGPEPAGGGGGTAAEEDALMYRIALRAALEEQGGLILVERDALQDVLQEMDLGASGLADARARTAIGKLLPASVLMIGDLVRADAGSSLFLRLVDTETTRVLGTVTGRSGAADDVHAVAKGLAEQIMARVTQAKPLAARAFHREGDYLTAGVGSFHGAREGTVFDIFQRLPPGGARPGEPFEKKVGIGQLVALGDDESTLLAEWEGDAGKDLRGQVWVVEPKAVEAQ